MLDIRPTSATFVLFSVRLQRKGSRDKRVIMPRRIAAQLLSTVDCRRAAQEATWSVRIDREHVDFMGVLTMPASPPRPGAATLLASKPYSVALRDAKQDDFPCEFLLTGVSLQRLWCFAMHVRFVFVV